MIDMTNPYAAQMNQSMQNGQQQPLGQPAPADQTAQQMAQPNAAMTAQQRMAIAQALMGAFRRDPNAGQIAMPQPLNGILPSG